MLEDTIECLKQYIKNNNDNQSFNIKSYGFENSEKIVKKGSEVYGKTGNRFETENNSISSEGK